MEEEIQSEMIRDYLEEIPHWTLRWGIAMLAVILLAVGWLGWFIHYPSIVRADFTLTSTNSPKAIIPKIEGRLEKLFVKENQFVKADQVLAYLESTAKHAEVLRLERQLNQLQKLVEQNDYVRINLFPVSNFEHLGEVQNLYQTFQQSYVHIVALFSNGYYLNRKNNILKNIQGSQHLNQHLQDQYKIYARDAELAEKEFQINEKLFSDQVIAPLDLNHEESKALSKKIPLKNIESSMVNNALQINSSQRELLEWEQTVIEQKENFKQALLSLQSNIETWKNRYLLVAPTSGYVYFPAILQEKQVIKASVELMYIGKDNYSFMGEVRIPQDNFGKVQVRQKVLIKFQGYPFEEFGSVPGVVSTIANLPSSDNQYFIAVVTLPQGLRTDQQKNLSYKIGMKASAEIITEDLRLLERLFYQFRRITH
ncbi:HlyD family secretion protein [Siphonobacter sp. SORGH_AS_1065]|uniref:HlyD family secretion protein n=1 Tax=Siphonobacter sp. SORGH_AS_1065 TaxID=3041795 RepID=UPI002781805A|nr:HlyD family efflux transporter periplasmic adaptor subunit [Siphonobacter sp. SORGH_AS_1065]MDQ1087441.1 multidrug efflux pump subunit AcrA (membrane-fusion protein) [Siphonobacter sp. SORGH_AS_1065]